MKHFMQNMLLALFINAVIFSGSIIDSLQYDYSASIECLIDSLKPKYGGGILRNPEFNQSIKGWSKYGYANIKTRNTTTGNRFGVATSRENPHQSVSQKIHLKQGLPYTLSAWVQTSEGNADVRAVFETSDDFIHAGVVEAKVGCWSMVKEGLSVDASGRAELYFDALMFLNEYNTLEYPGDALSTPAKYLDKLKDMWNYPGNRTKMAIGLEGHFSVPNTPYIRSALDTLATAKVPIWLTEVDVSPKVGNQARYLEQILSEAFSHPAVQGILVFTAWHPGGCNIMCLTDDNFKNLPTGDVVDKVIAQWRSASIEGTTDADGFFEARLFHGKCEMKLNHINAFSTIVQSFFVDADSSQDTVLLPVDI